MVLFSIIYVEMSKGVFLYNILVFTLSLLRKSNVCYFFHFFFFN